jgi:EAL domain-containing protein (putative c-di-GMP-specific phosphodiesterase class I)
MRMWEVDDNRAMPSNLVLEQDFILRIRRLNRLGKPHLVINIALNATDSMQGGRGPMEKVQARLQAFAQSHDGVYAEMSNGDVFLTWPDNGAARALPDLVMSVVFPDGPVSEDTVALCRLIYRLPGDYALLRERTNHYIAAARTLLASENVISTAQILQSEAARGPLTAWGVTHIEKLLLDIDLPRYVRTQPIYEHQDDGRWSPLFEECYISFEELRRTHFPKMDIAVHEHLFLDLCQSLDRRLLAELTQRFDTASGRHLSLNLALTSVMGTVFAQFAHKVPRAEHSTIGFELHSGDLFQDFALTLNAIETLRHEGFKVLIDCVTPDMLGYLDPTAFNVDYIKLNVAKGLAAPLNDREMFTALSQIPREKLIFNRCDSEEALLTGVKLGVTRFQGWLIDDLARAQNEEPPLLEKGNRIDRS